MAVRSALLTLLAVLFCAVPGTAGAQVLRVWTADDGEKLGTDASGAGASGAGASGAGASGAGASGAGASGAGAAAVVELFGMRNETVAFQVAVPVGPAGASEVSVTVEGLGLARASVFREDTVQVAERSHGLVWKPGSAAEPGGLKGRVPDRLVPLLPGSSLQLEPSQTRVFWIDLWISRDAPPGLATGQVVVRANAGCESGCTVDMQLEILDREMPDESHARSMVWFSASDLNDDRVAARYFSDPTEASDEDKATLRLRHYQLAREHRITLIGQHEAIDPELDALLSGRAFSAAMGYTGPGQGRGLDVLALHAYGGELTSAEASALLEQVTKYPDLRDTFVYVMDEPADEQRDEVNRRVRVSRPMPSFVTTSYRPGLDADIFALLAGRYSRKNASAGRAAGRQIWIYNGERPFTGSFALDDVAIATRVNPWIQYKLEIPRWFYWEATYYDDFQGKRGAIDVARDGLNFSNRHGDRVNGDGLLMYPGRDYLFPDSDAGIAGPLPSIRLKNWRRGIEDVEYLVMARKAGYGAQVDALLATLLPRVVDQVSGSEAVHFPEDGETWRKARRYLFELLRDGHSDIHLEAVLVRAPASRWRLLAALAIAGVGLLALAWGVMRHRHAEG